MDTLAKWLCLFFLPSHGTPFWHPYWLILDIMLFFVLNFSNIHEKQKAQVKKVINIYMKIIIAKILRKYALD